MLTRAFTLSPSALPCCSSSLSVHTGLASDQFISTVPNGRWLYFGNGSRVVRYDTTTPGLIQVWNQNGIANGSATPQGYSLILGINFIQSATPTLLPDGSFFEDMTVVNDPVVNALFPRAAATPPRNGAGVGWLLAASTLPTVESCVQRCGRPLLLLASTVHLELAAQERHPIRFPQSAAFCLYPALLILAACCTCKPTGGYRTNSSGFCRIDVNPVTGATSLSHCFQPDATFFPGQTAAAAPNALGQQIVYVPDASGFTSNIYRFLFTPDASGGTITPTGILSGVRQQEGHQS